jgi:hypothetical protein
MTQFPQPLNFFVGQFDQLFPHFPEDILADAYQI